MTVLITSAGAKVLLVEAFRAAAAVRNLRVTAGDTAEDCAAAHFADAYVRLPPTSDEARFLDHLMALCREEGISLVVPTRDGELPLFARARERFQENGIRLLVSPEPAVALCRDKVAFTRFLESHGFPVLPALDPSAPDLPFPLFLRPRDGAGGRGMRRVDSRAELDTIDDVSSYLINRWLDPHHARELTIDTLMTLDGAPLQAVARTRDNVVGGESKISTTVDAPKLTDLSLEIGTALGLVGHITMQAFQLDDEQFSFIEINPRFGGASNLSIEAGLASPERILAMHLGDGDPLAPRKIRYGLRMLRYQRDVIVEAGEP